MTPADAVACDGCGAETSGAQTYRDDDGERIARLCPGCQDLLDLRGADVAEFIAEGPVGYQIRREGLCDLYCRTYPLAYHTATAHVGDGEARDDGHQTHEIVAVFQRGEW